MKTMNEAVKEKIRFLSCEKQGVLIAIDGRCAAGKTTLAAHLRESLSCNIIHMDHFFLRPEQPTPERLREPGGNIDYERLLKEVLLPLKQSEPISYRPYDCHNQSFGEAISLQPNLIHVIEGSYSCHPVLRDHYDLRIFLSVHPGEQLRRIRQRNGELSAAQFRDIWIPLEERYFLFCDVQEHCDLQYQSQ